MADIRVTLDAQQISFPREPCTEDTDVTEVSIVGYPDEDLEQGQVLLDLGKGRPSVVFYTRDLLRALRPFDDLER